MGMLLKLKWAISSRSLLGANPSYYPDEPHKPRRRIVADQFRFFLKHGYLEEYYYPYGFDRASLDRRRMDAYIVPYRAFLQRVDRLNFRDPASDGVQEQVSCRAFNQDKYYFYLLLSRLGIPTPRLRLYVRGGSLLYLDEALSPRAASSLPVREQLAAILSAGIDGFAKPVDGMMGSGAFSIRASEEGVFADGQPIAAEALADRLLAGNYLVQERIVQHAALAALCPSSVNTLRLHTVMDRDGKVVSFGPLLRMGRTGRSVDNWAQGGILAAVDPETGRLKGKGFLKPGYGTTVTEHPDTHVPLDGYAVPFFHEATEMVVRLHQTMYRSHSVGWDVAVTENGPVVVEGNDRWEISMIQAVHGPMTALKPYFE